MSLIRFRSEAIIFAPRDNEDHSGTRHWRQYSLPPTWYLFTINAMEGKSEAELEIERVNSIMEKRLQELKAEHENYPPAITDEEIAEVTSRAADDHIPAAGSSKTPQ